MGTGGADPGAIMTTVNAIVCTECGLRFMLGVDLVDVIHRLRVTDSFREKWHLPRAYYARVRVLTETGSLKPYWLDASGKRCPEPPGWAARIKVGER